MTINQMENYLKNRSIKGGSVVFLGYFILFIMKIILSKEGVKENKMYKYLQRSLTHTESKNGFILKDIVIKNSFKLTDIDSVFRSINQILDYYSQTFTKDEYSRIINSWNDLGLKDLRDDLKQEKSALNELILKLDSVDNLDINYLIDLYEMVVGSNRCFNDFFTPPDLSKAISKLALEGLKKNTQYIYQTKINILDPSCGCSRLLYDFLIGIKSYDENIEINLFGIDLNNQHRIFSESILSLVNFNHTFVFHGNTLTDNFDLPAIDVCLSNPPYNKKRIEHDFVEYIEQLNCRSYIVLPKSFGFSKHSEKLRKRLITTDMIEGIISLPTNIFRHTDIATDIYILNKMKTL